MIEILCGMVFIIIILLLRIDSSLNAILSNIRYYLKDKTDLNDNF